MKTLTQAYELIQLLSSFHFLSPTLVRVSNPQTFNFYCTYDPDTDEVKSCNNLIDCSYSQRIWGNRASALGGIVGVGIAECSVVVSFGSSWPLAIAATGIQEIIGRTAGANIETIKNEVKLKWEREQRENEINNLKEQLREAIRRRDEYRERWGESDSNYLRERVRVEELENQIRELENSSNNND